MSAITRVMPTDFRRFEGSGDLLTTVVIRSAISKVTPPCALMTSRHLSINLFLIAARSSLRSAIVTCLGWLSSAWAVCWGPEDRLARDVLGDGAAAVLCRASKPGTTWL